MFKFQRLNVWVKAKDYSRELFLIANRLPSSYRFSFADQLIRAGLSITNNIAEGTGRLTSLEQRNFYNMAKGSVYETDEISKMLTGLINRK